MNNFTVGQNERKSMILENVNVEAVIFSQALTTHVANIRLFQGGKEYTILNAVAKRFSDVSTHPLQVVDKAILFGTNINLRGEDRMTIEVSNTEATAIGVTAIEGTGAQEYIPEFQTFDISSTNYIFKVGHGVKRLLLSGSNTTTQINLKSDKVNVILAKDQIDGISAIQPTPWASYFHNGVELNDVNLEVSNPQASSYVTAFKTVTNSYVSANYERRSAMHESADAASAYKTYK